jgi:hypothetical protein
MKGYIATTLHELASTDFPSQKTSPPTAMMVRIEFPRPFEQSKHLPIPFGSHEMTHCTAIRRTIIVTSGPYWMLKLRNIMQTQQPFQLPIDITATFDSTLYYADPHHTNGVGSIAYAVLKNCSRSSEIAIKLDYQCIFGKVTQPQHAIMKDNL